MLNAILFLLIVVGWTTCLMRWGIFSLPTMGILGLTAYSVPAVLGLAYPYQLLGESRDIPLVEIGYGPTVATAVMWTVLTIWLALGRRTLRASGNNRPDLDLIDSFITGMAVLALFGLIWTMFQEGPTYFLSPRSQQTESLVKLELRWINSAGLVAACLRHKPSYMILFGCGLVTHFLSGDRTVVSITLVALFICVPLIFSRNSKKFKLGVVLFPTIGVLFILLGKAFYLAVKAADMQILTSYVSPDSIDTILKSYEPFVTTNSLQLIIDRDFRTDPIEFIVGCFGQLLIIPSLFNIDSSAFNSNISAEFANGLTWGIAGSYIGQGYSLAGYVGVGFFSVMFIATLTWLENLRFRGGQVRLVIVAVIGALIAVYAHRNSVENLLSFVRQILLGCALPYAYALIRRSRRATDPQGRK